MACLGLVDTCKSILDRCGIVGKCLFCPLILVWCPDVQQLKAKVNSPWSLATMSVLPVRSRRNSSRSISRLRRTGTRSEGIDRRRVEDATLSVTIKSRLPQTGPCLRPVSTLPPLHTGHIRGNGTSHFLHDRYHELNRVDRAPTRLLDVHAQTSVSQTGRRRPKRASAQ